MTVTPTSSIALAVQSVIDLVANSTTFQERVSKYHYGGEPVTAAMAKRHIYGFDQFDTMEGSKEARPFAIVGILQHTMQAVAQCSQKQFSVGGGIFLVLADNARETCNLDGTPADLYNASYLDALNWIGGTLDGLSGPALANVPFPPNSVDQVLEVTRPDITQRQTDDYWIAMYSILFGNEGAG